MNTESEPQTTPELLEPWINTAKACQHLGISIPTIRRWIKDGRIEPKRTPSGEFRFRLSELDSVLD